MYLGGKLRVLMALSWFKQVVQAGRSVFFARISYLLLYTDFVAVQTGTGLMLNASLKGLLPSITATSLVRQCEEGILVGYSEQPSLETQGRKIS